MKKGCLNILLFSLAFFVVTHAGAQTREDLEKKRKEIQQEISSLQQAQSAITKDKKVVIDFH